MTETPFVPGDGRTAHVDSFARDNLPPAELWAEIDYGGVPELAAYPDRMNAAAELLDRHVAAGDGVRRVFHFPGADWTYGDLKDRADRIARVLVDDYGLVPGNRVLLRGRDVGLTCVHRREECLRARHRTSGMRISATGPGPRLQPTALGAKPRCRQVRGWLRPSA